MIITLDVDVRHFASRFRRPKQALSPWAQYWRAGLIRELREHLSYQS
jgi:hypothetical protein